MYIERINKTFEFKKGCINSEQLKQIVFFYCLYKSVCLLTVWLLNYFCKLAKVVIFYLVPTLSANINNSFKIDKDGKRANLKTYKENRNWNSYLARTVLSC